LLQRKRDFTVFLHFPNMGLTCLANHWAKSRFDIVRRSGRDFWSLELSHGTWGAVTAIEKAQMFVDRILKTRVPSLICAIGICLLLCAAAFALPGRKKEAVQYGTGLTVNVELPPDEVTRVVDEVVQNGIIRGSKEYSKDEYITGATAAKTTSVFPEWMEGGKVFYKQKLKAIDPLNFKSTNDVGTVAVRYVVQPQSNKSTVLRIDAIFMQDSRRSKHPSNGSVESAEYKNIQDRLDAIESAKKEALDEENRRQEQLARKQNLGWSDNASAPAAKTSGAPTQSAAVSSQPLSETSAATAQQKTSQPAPSDPVPPPQATEQPDQAVEAALQPGETLEQHVANLRRQVERTVKTPGAPLKAAPFHNASTVKVLKPGTEVLVLIDTPYWFGIETHDGDHGWIPREQLEQVQ
jgi:hypothetical protein